VFGTKPDDDDHNVDGTAAYVEIDGSSWQYTGRVVDIRDGVLILHGRGRRCVNGELEYSDPHTFVWPTHRLRVARMPA
jgi:hypothetical protein